MSPLLSPHCAQGLVYSHTEQALTDVDWLIARLKAELTTGPSDGVCLVGKQVIIIAIKTLIESTYTN